MLSSSMAGLGIFLVMLSGCTPIADNNPRQGEPSSAPVQSTPPAANEANEDDRAVASPSQGGPASAPFIAETKAAVPVINVMNPGRLEVVDGCLTVMVRGRERATAVFPPGVKPELKGNDVVAVSFEGRRIPLGQETPIPGGLIDSSSADLVKPIPSYCPQTLFGLGG